MGCTVDLNDHTGFHDGKHTIDTLYVQETFEYGLNFAFELIHSWQMAK